MERSLAWWSFPCCLISLRPDLLQSSGVAFFASSDIVSIASIVLARLDFNWFALLFCLKPSLGMGSFGCLGRFRWRRVRSSGLFPVTLDLLARFVFVVFGYFLSLELFICTLFLCLYWDSICWLYLDLESFYQWNESIFN